MKFNEFMILQHPSGYRKRKNSPGDQEKTKKMRIKETEEIL